MKKIDIFDVRMESVRTVNIDLPFQIGTDVYSTQTIFIANEEGDNVDIIVIVNGYMRKYLGAKHIPIELIDLVVEFYRKQYLHVVVSVRYTWQHWKISLDYIFGQL